MVWLYIGIILVMRVVQHTFDKFNAKSVPSNSIGYLKYTVFYEGVACVFALGLFAVQMLRDPGVSHVGSTLLYASISGVALAVSCCCSIYALSTGTIVLSSMFGTAGLLVPTIAGIFLYDEILNVWQWLAIGVFMVAAWLLIGGSKTTYGKFTLKTFFVLLASLLMGGLTMLMQTMFGRSVEGGNVALFSVFSFAAGAALLGVLLLVFTLLVRGRRRAANAVALPENAESADTGKESSAAETRAHDEVAADDDATSDSKKAAGDDTTSDSKKAAGDDTMSDDKNITAEQAATPKQATAGDFVLVPLEKEKTVLPKKVYLYALFLAVAVFLINQLATLSTPLVSPAILFAFINGGSTIISAIVGAVLYKEKPNLRTVIGIVLGVGSLILLKVFA